MGLLRSAGINSNVTGYGKYANPKQPFLPVSRHEDQPMCANGDSDTMGKSTPS